MKIENRKIITESLALQNWMRKAQINRKSE
jgi:hypothetical protein